METTKPNETWNQPNNLEQPQENKKVLAGVLALLFGGIGIHKFVLGYTKEGIIQIILSVVSCGILGIIPFKEGTTISFIFSILVARKLDALLFFIIITTTLNGTVFNKVQHV